MCVGLEIKYRYQFFSEKSSLDEINKVFRSSLVFRLPCPPFASTVLDCKISNRILQRKVSNNSHGSTTFIAKTSDSFTASSSNS